MINGLMNRWINGKIDGSRDQILVSTMIPMPCGFLYDYRLLRMGFPKAHHYPHCCWPFSYFFTRSIPPEQPKICLQLTSS